MHKRAENISKLRNSCVLKEISEEEAEEAVAQGK